VRVPHQIDLVGRDNDVNLIVLVLVLVVGFAPQQDEVGFAPQQDELVVSLNSVLQEPVVGKEGT